MIRHLVFVKVRADVPRSEIEAVFAQLGGLRAVLPGMTAFAHGANLSAEGLSRGFTHAFTMDFDDARARDAYLAHPNHLEAGARLVRAAENGTDGLIVLDIAL